MQVWEDRARSWLSSLPGHRSPSAAEMDAWVDSDPSILPEELNAVPRSELHQRILSVHGLLAGPSQVEGDDRAEEGPRGRFQRAEHWNPVYSWLESLDTNEVVQAKDIKDWFLANPDIKENLAKNSRYHLMHYIQRVHMKILRRQGKLQKKGGQNCNTRTSVKIPNNGLRVRGVPIPCKFSSKMSEDKEVSIFKKNEAFLRYELLTELQNQLTSLLSKHNHVNDLKESCSPALLRQRSVENLNHRSSDFDEEREIIGAILGQASHSQYVENFCADRQSKLGSSLDLTARLKRKRNVGVVSHAWSYCEALSGPIDDPSSSLKCEGTREKYIGIQDVDSESLQKSSSCKAVALSKKNIIKCLQGRERGISWPLACSHGGYVGRSQEKWIPFFEGWKSLGRQFEGPAVWLGRRTCSSWIPTWSAYTSSVAVAQPFGRLDSVQKVLDVRFHPEGLAQLVCSSNEAPNELLLYNLLSGRAIQLSGHNCQIQAVEFAVRGASVVSCGANLMKVWDATTGSCLFTLGPVGDNRGSTGHTAKINAMTVNSWQSCLVVTSGGQGDGKLLLWNALTGELSSDLNVNLRSKDCVFPSIEAMEFCSQNLLVCGSDSAYGGPAVVQLWDIECPESWTSFPACDSYVTSLKTNPDCNTIITGAGDGSVNLFDIRMCSGISHLSVGASYEVTSVSFSSCGNYFHASSTSNNTLVWDTRFMPMNRGQTSVEVSPSINDLHSMRPLHCLSHGKQMPTAEHAGQVPGHVDEGDQGVNDARWLQRDPVLVTVSGDGSIAMWDVTLGQPCMRHLISHTRCVNTVAVAPNDEYLCSGGDDQKVVLYHNRRGPAHVKWRLSHPL